MSASEQKSPVFKVLIDELTKKIQARHFAPGSTLPSENELSDLYGISRFSVRKALSILETDGLIMRQAGVGSIVCELSGGIALKKPLNIGINGPFSDPYSSGLVSEMFYSGIVYESARAACSTENARLIQTSTEEFIAKKGEGVDAFFCISRKESYSSWQQLNEIASSGKPVVFINRITDLSHIAYVAVDYELESMRAAEFLLRLGKKNIGLVTVECQYADIVRSHGFKLAHEGRAQAVRSCLISGDSVGALEVLEKFIEFEKPDALFVTSFRLLSYALLARRNLRRQDISIFCFDKLEKNTYRENVMYVDMPLWDMTQNAFQYLIQASRSNKPVPVLRQLYGCDFILDSNFR